MACGEDAGVSGEIVLKRKDMKHGSLFSGIGGFDLAAEWMGWDNVFHCEWEDFPRKVLKYYWPNAISYGDITQTDFNVHRGEIDILTGGFPCQPYSAAGKRQGTEDARHLWPEMLRVIREVAPKYVVGENVYGLVNWNGGLVFDEVQSDLEAAGYSVQPVILPACGVGAPHRRDRVWFVAYRDSGDSVRERTESRRNSEGDRGDGKTGSAADTCARNTREGDAPTQGSSKRTAKRRKTDSTGTSCGQSFCRPFKGEGNKRSSNIQRGDAANTSHQGLQGGKVNGGTSGIGAQRDKQPTRCVPPNWQNFPTQSPICSRNDGLPTELDGITFPKWRNESIKAYGNAIVPQVAHEIFKAIDAHFRNHTKN